MGKFETKAAFLAALQRHPDGLTSDKAAAIVGSPLRSARRYLSILHTEGKATREPTYTGQPPVFGWRYRAVP